ncbi:MAG: YebC/PmpR family DNA-binding transcriptional regulator [Candidatus Methylomirabilales bacterium]
MSGHSKWAQTKHKKAAVDARRGKVFGKALRAIEVAAREGGGNPEANPTLADAITRARAASVPTDTISRAIKRGTGELEGTAYENLVYEGYAPGGVAVLVEVLTDNRNRAAADVRRIFARHGGTFGEPGSVSWMFSRRGVLLIPKETVAEEEVLSVALQEGAEDVKEEGDMWELSCPPTDLEGLRRGVEAAGLPVESARLVMAPSATIPLDAPVALGVLRLVDELEESDDVQEVFANFDVPDEVMTEAAG